MKNKSNAFRKAEAICKKENTPVYVFEIAKLATPHIKDFIVSKSKKICITDDSTACVIKTFMPTYVVSIKDCEKYRKKHKLNYYIIDRILRKYYLTERPSLFDFIRNQICLINSTEMSIKDNDELQIIQIQSFENFCDKNNINIFNKSFDIVLTKFLNLLSLNC